MSKQFLISLTLGITFTLFAHGAKNIESSIKFHNDIHSFRQLGLPALGLGALEPLIKHCDILINNILIPHGQSRLIKVINNTCSITISARLDYFDVIFNFRSFNKKITPLFKCNLIFKKYNIHPHDIQHLETSDDGQLDISSVIVDLLDVYNLLDPNNQLTYTWKFHPFRTIAVIIL